MKDKIKFSMTKVERHDGMVHLFYSVFTWGFKIKERRKRATIRKASVWVPQFIKERVNASFQLQYHNRKGLSIV